MRIIRIRAGALLILVFGIFGVAAQDKVRRIEQPAKFVYSNTPIQVAIVLDGKEISSREVRAGSDWLRRIGLQVTNSSGKDINSLWINLMLKEPVYGASVVDAHSAGIVITIELRHSDVKVLKAGDQVTLKPPVALVDYWLKYAREQGMLDIERVILDIKQVGFTDDSGWERGSPTRKDPLSGRWVFVYAIQPETNGVTPAILRYLPDIVSRRVQWHRRA